MPTTTDMASFELTDEDAKLNDLNLNAIGARHTVWVEAMGWHNKTVLESLALIASEIGEAAGECLGGFDRDKFSEELADILLRITDLAMTEGVDLDAEVAKVQLNWKAHTLGEALAEILVDYAHWSNAARKKILEQDFAQGMARVTARVIELATACHIELHHEIQRKLEKNALRGTRGRII